MRRRHLSFSASNWLFSSLTRSSSVDTTRDSCCCSDTLCAYLDYPLERNMQFGHTSIVQCSLSQKKKKLYLMVSNGDLQLCALGLEVAAFGLHLLQLHILALSSGGIVSHLTPQVLTLFVHLIQSCQQRRLLCLNGLFKTECDEKCI